MDKRNKYWQLFLSTFKLSACTFGGGFVIIPLMRKRFVEELHWIEEEEMLDLTAIAQSSPGSIAINASILVGYHVGGIPGALVTLGPQGELQLPQKAMEVFSLEPGEELLVLGEEGSGIAMTKKEGFFAKIKG